MNFHVKGNVTDKLQANDRAPLSIAIRRRHSERQHPSPGCSTIFRVES